MLFISGLNLDCHYNLAAEEYFLRNFDEEIFMLWQSEKAIVIGKHQNALAEINIPFVFKNHIPVVRRLSGGGTVFHDLGNINFTFIKNADDQSKMIDFKKYASPILDSLKHLNLDAYFSPRNDIFIGNKKISGNAEHLYQKKKRVLHHGTLLFDSNLSALNEAIKTNPELYHDKAVNSVRSEVANIRLHLETPINIAQFKQHVFDTVWNANADAVHYSLNDEDMLQIQNLAIEKYKQWHWNFGYSPKYSVERTFSIHGEAIEVTLFVEKGEIYEVQSTNVNFQLLNGLTHNPFIIKSGLLQWLDEPTAEEVTWLLF